MAQPIKQISGAISWELISEGSEVPEYYRLIRLEVEKKINKVPTVTIEVLDGDIAKQDFELSGEDVFEPGAEIEIKMGYGQVTTSVFKGIVIRQNVRSGEQNESRMSIVCKDISYRMTVGRKNFNFIEQTDADIISKLVGNYSGLTTAVGTTSTKYFEMVQYHCTDWDFLLMRAKANGFVVIARDGKLTVDKPDVSGSPNWLVAYGADLIDFDLSTNAASQLGSVTSFAWDPNTQEVVQQEVAPLQLTDQGNLDSKKLSAVVELETLELQSPTPMEASDLKAWAQGRQLQAALGRITGSLKVTGTAEVEVGDLVDLDGVGKRFTGTVYVSGVTHVLDQGAWTTEIQTGIEDDWSNDEDSVSTPAAAGTVAGITGLQIGKVLKLEQDPAKDYRIQVELPIARSQEPGIWARFSSVYASSGDDPVGAFVLPEIGDEVVLGFLDGNPAHGIILGSLYSGKHKPYQDMLNDNNIKGFVSRNQLKVEFNEEDKSITVVTPAENTIVIDDKKKSILVQDQTGNKVELTTDGITMDSPKDIVIKADGKIDITATKNITMTSSTGDVSVTANNIKNDAKMAFSAKGNAQAELVASGQTTVKGAMVMIN